MNNEKELYELKESLINELASYNRTRMDKSAICEIDVLAHATKNLCKIIESMEESGYSDRGNSYRRSYARGGNNSRRSYNSYHTPHELVEELRELMNDAPDEASRQDFQRLIMKLESM